MNKKLLLAAPIGAPGPLTALRNHYKILKNHFDCQFASLEELVFPFCNKLNKHKNFCDRAARRLKWVSVNRLIPFGENIIFASYGRIYKTIIAKLNKKGIRPSFIWCSTLGQLEMTPGERASFVAMIELLKKGRIKYLLLHRRLYKTIGVFLKEVVFLPHSIDLVELQGVEKLNLPGLNIDLFCRPRYGKNILNQLLAFEIARLDGKLHINFDVNKFNGIVELISSKYIQHRWIPQNSYFSLISSMDLALQVTIGESFNYAVCEHMALGVPVLTTEDIYLVSGDKYLAKYLCVPAADTPPVIAEYIRKIVTDRNLHNELANRCRERIARVAEDNNKIVIQKIKELFG